MMAMVPLLQQYPVTPHSTSRHGGALPDPSRADPGDEAATSSLLTFVDMASSNIKLALDKPVRSKRKVNHRKYLQKQLKRCNGSAPSVGGGVPRKAGGREEGDVAYEEEKGSSFAQTPPSTPPLPVGRQTSVVVSHGQAAAAAGGVCGGGKAGRKEQVQAGLQNKSLAALFDPRTLHERCCTDPQPRCASGAKVPLRQRNLPASFFTEPAAKLLSSISPPHDVATCGHGPSVDHSNQHIHPHPHSHPGIGYPVVHRLSMQHSLPVANPCVEMTYNDDVGARYTERSSCVHTPQGEEGRVPTSHGLVSCVHTSHTSQEMGHGAHDRDTRIVDTVDQMLNGGETPTDTTTSGRGLAQLLVAQTSSDQWPSAAMAGLTGSADDSGGSRGSANTTPCSSASGGGGGVTAHLPPSASNPDLLQAALCAADVSHKGALLSPAASPSPTSCSGGSVGWSGYPRVGTVTPPVGSTRGHLQEEVMMSGVGAVTNSHHQGRGSSSRDSTPTPNTFSPPSTTMEPEMTTMSGPEVRVIAGPEAYPYSPVTCQHYSDSPTAIHYSTPIPGPMVSAFTHTHNSSSPQEFPYSRSPLPHPQLPSHHFPHHSYPDPSRLLHPAHDDARYHTASLPVPGTPPDFHTGYDAMGQSAHAHFFPGTHNHHLESQQHPGILGVMGEHYSPRDAGAIWQGTTVYGQLSSCYSYL